MNDLKPGKSNHQGEGGGRPRKWETVADFEKQVEGYFASLNPSDTNRFGIPATLSGLCLALDTFPNVLRDYENGNYDDENNKFSTAVKKARLRVIQFAEQALYTARSAAGPIFHIFNLTRNAKDDADRWKNAQSHEHSGPGGGPIQHSIAEQIRGAHADEGN